jgi:type II secretory pathway component PulJ
VKIFSLLSVVAALAIGGYLLAAQARTVEPTGDAERAVTARASEQVAAANLHAAASAMEAAHATAGTYAGAALGGFGVRLVRADTSRYCLEAGRGPALFHLTGPRGAPAAGPCT